MPDVLMGESDRPRKKAVQRSTDGVLQSVASPLLAFGLVLVGVGVVDLALAWFPLRFGVGEWEFGTASRTFDSLALGTTGYVFLVIGATLRRWSLGLRVLAGLAGAALVLLLMVFALYAFNVPIALRAVADGSRSMMQRAVIRSTLFGLMYISLFGWMSWFTWRRGGAEKGAPPS